MYSMYNPTLMNHPAFRAAGQAIVVDPNAAPPVLPPVAPPLLPPAPVVVPSGPPVVVAPPPAVAPPAGGGGLVAFALTALAAGLGSYVGARLAAAPPSGVRRLVATQTASRRSSTRVR